MDQSASLHIPPRSSSRTEEWWVLEAALTAWGFHRLGSTPESASTTFIHRASVLAVTLLCGLTYDTKRVSSSPRISDTCKDISE